MRPFFEYLKAKLNQSRQLRAYRSYMADCSQFLVNYWAGETVLKSRYYDIIQPIKGNNSKDVDATEIVERIKNGLNDLERSAQNGNVSI